MAQKTSRPKRIAVLMTIDRRFRRGLMTGICAFARPGRNWELRLMAGTKQALPMLKRIRPDGIISHLGNIEMAKSLMQLNVPMVNCSSRAPIANLPTVSVDNVAIGQMAKEYFQKRGFENYALCGRPRLTGILSRGQAFENAVTGAGFSFHKFLRWPRIITSGEESWLNTDTASKLRRWLKQLPKPVAIFCSDDMAAIQTIAACKDTGIQVPDDAAVLGVDNDEVLCQMIFPQVSSISLPQEEIGYQAAALLDKIIGGHSRPPEESREHKKLFAPVEVATRASTDIIAVDDPVIATALKYIRENRDVLIGVSDVAEACRVSRRSLELHFRKTFNRTVASQIRRAHVDQASWLLRDTKWTIEKIAKACGYRSAERLTVAFRKETGQTPGKYRKRFIDVQPGMNETQ